MADENIEDTPTCGCEEGGGIPHRHRLPPYDTETRNAALHAASKRPPSKPMPIFDEDDDTLDSPHPSPTVGETVPKATEEKKEERKTATRMHPEPCQCYFCKCFDQLAELDQELL